MGRQAQYGTLRLRLDGQIERPKVELTLDRPNEALGIRDMTLFLDPNAPGFDYRANGQSRLGPFTSNGQILLPKGGRAVIDIAALDVAGSTRAAAARRSWRLHRAAAPRRRPLSGTLDFAPQNGDQRIEAHLAANNLSVPGDSRSASAGPGRRDDHPRRGPNDARTAWSRARGLTTSGISLARLTANARLVNGSGEVRAALAGTRGTAFELVTVAQVSPDRISLTGRGELARRPLTLDSPVVLTRVAGGWQIAPTRIASAAGGHAVGPDRRAAGVPRRHPGDAAATARHRLAQGRAGRIASGRIDYRWEGAPSGSANLRVRGLSRAGLVLASKPIDVGVNAGAGRRPGGNARGRGQRRQDHRPGPGAVRSARTRADRGRADECADAAPAALCRAGRHAVAAVGVETFDLSGPIAVGADIGGRLVDPQIRGSIKADGAGWKARSPAP